MMRAFKTKRPQAVDITWRKQNHQWNLNDQQKKLSSPYHHNASTTEYHGEERIRREAMMLSYFEPPATINYGVRRDFKVFWKISHSIETIEELFC